MQSGVSIIILTHNGAHHMERLLDSFLKTNTFKPVELIIIDHDSRDHTEAVVGRYHTKAFIRYIKMDQNQSFAISCNFGARKARYANLLFLNNDIIYTADVLPAAVEKLKDPAIGAVGVRLDDDPAALPMGRQPRVQHTGIDFQWDADKGFHRPIQIRHNTLADAQKVPSGTYPAVTGAFLLCRKSDFDRIGGFCEEYDFGFEDIDFCLQLRTRLNKQCWCINDMSLQHIEGAARALAPDPVRKARRENNDAVFKRRMGATIEGSKIRYKAYLDVNENLYCSNLNKDDTDGILLSNYEKDTKFFIEKDKNKTDDDSNFPDSISKMSNYNSKLESIYQDQIVALTLMQKIEKNCKNLLEGWVFSTKRNDRITKIFLVLSKTIFCVTNNLPKREDVCKIYQVENAVNFSFDYTMLKLTSGIYHASLIVEINSNCLNKGNNFFISIHEESYKSWIKVNEFNSKKKSLLKDRLISVYNFLPKISIIMPVYNTIANFLEKAIDSVSKQIYSNWELCISDDGSTNTETINYLNSIINIDNRIKIVFGSTNKGIAENTNRAASLATGDYVALMDCDDMLSPDCLAEVALHLYKNHSDFLYTDCDAIDEKERRFNPRFRPGWSPELLLSYMYCGHLKVIEKSLFTALGGLRSGFPGSEDHDLVLRLTERAYRIDHLPKVLYHWRNIPNQQTSSTRRLECIKSGQKAVKEALQRRNICGDVYHPEWAKNRNIGLYAISFQNQGPDVAILIPTKNNFETLKRCLKSIEKTTYKNYNVYILDNGSNDKKLLDFYKSHKLNIFTINEKFNFSKIINTGAKKVKEEFLLFLNDDTEVINKNWLSSMVGYTQFPGVAIVGAKLLYPNCKIQHVGIVGGLQRGVSSHLLKGLDVKDSGYLFLASATSNCSGVTAACMLTSKKLFLSMGGFDEDRFAVAYNDLDYCFRALKNGFRIVCVKEAMLCHYEGKSRGRGAHNDNPIEIANKQTKYHSFNDKYYNPNFSRHSNNCKINPKIFLNFKAKPIKIICYTHNLNPEGAPFSQFELVSGLKAIGTLDPIVVSRKDGNLRTKYENNKIKVIIDEEPKHFRSSYENYYKSIVRLGEVFKKNNAELVYANTLQTFYAIAAAKHLKLPSIWNIRESEPTDKYFDFCSPDVKNTVYELFNFTYKNIFVSYYTMKHWIKFNVANNFYLIPNSINIKRFDNALTLEKRKAKEKIDASPSEFLILSVGTICERKNQLFLLKAFVKAQASMPKSSLYLVGDRDNQYSRDLKRHVSELDNSIKRNIHIIAECPDIGKYYAAADMFALTSLVESYPRTILEAMYFGLPIISTDIFGTKEQIWDNINGFLVQTNDLDSFIQKLIYLSRDNQLREKFSNSSSAIFKTFDTFEQMIKNYGRLFQEAQLHF
jgi:GT2 family glycosyltransferase/glycosyltransferase involved in cell wall biosynthesis